MMTNEQFIEAASYRYLTDALFAARANLVGQILALEPEPEDRIITAIMCGLYSAYLNGDGNPTTPEIDYNLAYAAGMEAAAREVHRKARFAYGRDDHAAAEDLLDVESALAAIVASLRSTNDRLLAEQTVRPTAQEKN
jgi:hypothetical protein